MASGDKSNTGLHNLTPEAIKSIAEQTFAYLDIAKKQGAAKTRADFRTVATKSIEDTHGKPAADFFNARLDDIDDISPVPQARARGGRS